MTDKNERYRTSQTMLRNEFPGTGEFEIPYIPEASFCEEDFNNLLLIGFDRTHKSDTANRNRMVHFFLYDYKFNCVWHNPDQLIDRIKNYRAVLSPDFSIYLEMNPTIQLYNVFRNRWCGAFWASKGIRVIPSVSWGDERTFHFCFLGIPKGSTVAVSTYMVSEHDNRCDQKEFFLTGYQELLRQVEPEQVICYHKPFPEMDGNIIYVDYELSSWKYQKAGRTPSPYIKYTTGRLLSPCRSDIVIKRAHILPSDKGMGSAYGGKWKPNPKKPNDAVFIGPPNTIQRIHISTKAGGYWIVAKYGDDGWAVAFRHETTHGNDRIHTNPHDHVPVEYNPHAHAPDWDRTPEINYPSDVPEFKTWKGDTGMINWDHIDGVITNLTYDEEAMRFKTLSEFHYCLSHGAEIVIEWKGIEYGIFKLHQNQRQDDLPYLIAQSGTIEVNQATELRCHTVDEILEYKVSGDRLRDVITQVTVIERTF